MNGIYIHIPFCRQACNYCNFYFVVSPKKIAAYIDAVIKEIDLTKNFFADKKIDTVYFGGGTPSQLSVNQFEKIIEKLHEVYDLSSMQEMTIEANPDDLTIDKISNFKALKKMGLNRFSIGVQSFYDADLQYMNRAHRSSEAIAAIKFAREAGFEKLTLDLIYGTPTLSDANWRENLNKLVELQLDNFSAYALTVEKKTNLHHLIKKNNIIAPDEEQTIRQFDILMDFAAENNFVQYEISNFAKQGKYGIHNTNYWDRHPYLGLGTAAHSFDGKSRYINRANIKLYMDAVAVGGLLCEEEKLSEKDIANEYIMTSLRTFRGCNLAHSAVKKYQLTIKEALLSMNKDWYVFDNNIILLTQKGKHVADYFSAMLFVE